MSVEHVDDLMQHLRWFGVWDLNPLGECECPAGGTYQLSGHDGTRVGWVGSCDSPGKHPWPGFPRGFRDAVVWDDWVGAGIREQVAAGGGRAAVAMPSWLWVLDADSHQGWTSLVCLIRAGAVPHEQVVAVARTRRGWHLYYRPPHEGGGWSGKTAQHAVDAAVRSIGRPVGGLDAKSAGGYVIWPDGRFGRALVDMQVFAKEAAYTAGPRPGSLPAVPALGAAGPPAGYAEVPGMGMGRGGDGGVSADQAKAALQQMMESLPPDQAQRWRESELAAMRLRMSQVPEGGRNTALNRVAFLEGRRCLEAGIPVAQVRAELEAWGLEMGLGQSEVSGTVRSGLGLGL